MSRKRRKRKKSRRPRKSRKRKPKMSLTRLRLIFTLIAVAIVVIVYLIATFLLPMFQQDDGSGCAGSADCLKGEVTKVVDGDTLYIGDVKIRLALVDTPEVGESGYEDAKNFTANLCPVGSQATADQDDLQLEDSYGRMLAVVYCDGKNLNRELLDNGHALILTQYCAESEFENDAWAKAHGC
jgi:endonuclease YncB( thermonuclease family)